MSNKNAFWFIPLASAAIFVTVIEIFAIFPIMPVQATQEAELVDRAFGHCVTLTAGLFALMLATLFYMLIWHRGRGAEEGPRLHHSKGWKVETVWIALSVFLTVGLAAYGWAALKNIYGAPEADWDIQVRAEQFSWEFYYPKFDQYGSRLYLPLGKRVRLSIVSKDVVHSFWVPEFRLKQDAVPGKVTTLLFTPSKAGVYTVMCNQLCGRDHTIMTSLAEILPEEEFKEKFSSKGEAW
jgi:cytochrome c oxidase subunit 2